MVAIDLGHLNGRSNLFILYCFSGLGGRSEDAKAVAHIRKAATQSMRSGPSANESRGVKTSSFTKIRKKLFIYEAKEHDT